jgi:hypothetical protein
MTTEFRYSRKTTIAYLIGSAVLSVLSLVALDHPAGKPAIPPWMPAVFLIATVGFAWMFIRPRRLVLDEQGFALTGGYVWRAIRFRWQDVGEFYVYQRAKGGEAIGFKLKQPTRDHARLAGKRSDEVGALAQQHYIPLIPAKAGTQFCPVESLGSEEPGPGDLEHPYGLEISGSPLSRG